MKEEERGRSTSLAFYRVRPSTRMIKMYIAIQESHKGHGQGEDEGTVLERLREQRE